MILQEGANCWKIDHAKQASFLVDADIYYKALYHTILRAERNVFILGWDVDSRVALVPGESPPFGKFLFETLERKPGLHVYILTWDFAFPYRPERQNPAELKAALTRHRRLHFVLDGTHPFIGSHHQKIVVVDDKIGFVGGLDITQRRWDTPVHEVSQKLRIDPTGKSYDPFHDVQAMVEGEVARSLGILARQRWHRATGEIINGISGDETSIWPEIIPAHATGVPVAIARTVPEFMSDSEVREVETLYLDAIRSARKTIYVENQYVTSIRLLDAIKERLGEKNGPEIVILVPCFNTGFEAPFMRALRARLLPGLREADPHHHLQIYYPTAADGTPINLHSKVLIVDDTFVRIGSANLNSRSMGLDTECDLAIEAGDEKNQNHIRKVISEFRNELLAEHLGVTRPDVDKAVSKGGLISAIESLRCQPKTLVPCLDQVPWWLDTITPHGSVIDPERPYEIIIRKLFSKPGVFVLTLLLIVGLLFGLWFATPLHEMLSPRNISAAVKPVVQGGPMGGLILIGGFTLLSVCMISINLLALATALLLPPYEAFFCSMTASLLSSAVLYWIGKRVGSKLVSDVHNEKIVAVKDFVSHNEVLTVALLRGVPLAPHWVVNLVFGSSGFKFGPFLLGTFIGLAPGLALISFLGEESGKILRHPLTIGAVLAVFLAFVIFASSKIRKKILAGKAGA